MACASIVGGVGYLSVQFSKTKNIFKNPFFYLFKSFFLTLDVPSTNLSILFTFLLIRILLLVHSNNHARFFAVFCITSGTYTTIGLIIAWCTSPFYILDPLTKQFRLQLTSFFIIFFSCLHQTIPSRPQSRIRDKTSSRYSSFHGHRPMW